MAQGSRSELSETSGATLGETAQTSVQISSTRGSIFTTHLYRCVNATDDPDLANELREGTLNQVECPFEKGRTYQPAFPVIYHDGTKKIFALVLPEALRHRELQCRQELLQELATSSEEIPGYMRSFQVVFDPEELEQLAETFDGKPSGWAEEPTQISEPPEMGISDEERADFQARIDKLEAALSAAQTGERSGPAPDPEFEAKAEKLRVDRAQLDEVASRVERDSARVDEAMTKIQSERAELDGLRQELEDERRKLQVKELNLEQEKLRLEQEGPASESAVPESTQVVTDDQFIEVVSSDDIAPAKDGGPAHSRPLIPAESDVIPENFSDLGDDGAPFFLESIDEMVVVGFGIDDERAQQFLAGRRELIFQLQKDQEIPVIALTLAVFGEDGGFQDALAATLTDSDEREALALGQLAQGREVHLGIYDADGLLVSAWKSKIQLPKNISWARRRLAQWREGAGSDSEEKIRKAAERVARGELDLWGSMEHPFLTQNFTDLDGASQVQLTVGIVEYWSKPEQIDYLVGKRAFSIEQLLHIQKNLIRQALNWGIALDEQLRTIAIEEAIIPDRISLTQRLLANFAEGCIGLRPNDLDPLEQWENWDALIQLAEQTGVTPDADVLELAEVTLKRAEEYQEVVESQDGQSEYEVLREEEASIEGLIVSRQSEATGVTYFLPDEAVMDTFDDLSSMERADLVLLLKDKEGRLEAAQILVERFGADALTEVLEASEDMNAAQITALAQFIEVRADTLEAALSQALDSAGPAATFIAARALASIGSAAALPRLLEAVGDPRRRGHGRRLADCLASFGDKLLPPLTRALKRDPDDQDLLVVLAALEESRSGTLDEMASDRSKALRSAARQAQKMV